MEKTTKQLGIITICGVALAVLACLVVPRAPYHSSDLMIYKTSLTVAIAGGNPYDPAEMREAFKSVVEDRGEPGNLMWNPPGFLIYPGALLLIPQGILYAIWPTFIVISAFSFTMIGSRLSGVRDVRAEHIVLAASASVPLFIEMYSSQLSSLVSLVPILGMVAYLNGAHFISGVLLSFGVLKPHAVFLPLCLIGIWTLHERRWRVMTGGLVGLLGLYGVSEAVVPGISELWIHRSSWPINIVGSALPGLIRKYVASLGHSDPVMLGLLWPGLGVILFARISERFKRERSAEVLVWAIMLNPLVTPYGFIFDQSVLVVAQAFWLARLAHVGRARLASVCIAVSNVIPIIFNQAFPSASPLATATYPIAFCISIAILFVNCAEFREQTRRVS